MKSRWMRNSFIYMIILGAVILAVVMFLRPSSSSRDIPLSQVVEEAQAGNVDLIRVSGDTLEVHLQGEREPLSSRKEEGTSIAEILGDRGVAVGPARARSRSRSAGRASSAISSGCSSTSCR